MINNLRVKVKVIFEYKGDEISSDIPSYKTIKYLKELAKKLFLPVYSEVRLIYQNKDITPFEQMIIGDYFYKKQEINLKVLSKNSKEEEKGEEKEILKLKKNFICSCQKKLISGYCRNCKEYICDSCKINSIHINHKIIQIDVNNLNESVKLFAFSLQSEISINLKETKSYLKSKSTNQKSIENEDNYFYEKKHQLFKEKYDKFYEMCNNIYNTINIDEEDNCEKNIKKYIKNSKGINEDIDKIINEIHIKFVKKKKIMSTEEFKEYIRVLSESDDNLEAYANDINLFKVNYQINKKINDFYDKLNNVMDEILLQKNPLGLDDDTYKIYKQIKHEKNKKKEENEIPQNNDMDDLNENLENENEEKNENSEKDESNNYNKNDYVDMEINNGNNDNNEYNEKENNNDENNELNKYNVEEEKNDNNNDNNATNNNDDNYNNDNNDNNNNNNNDIQENNNYEYKESEDKEDD